ncbi:hypothetical protein [Clostridium lundense]|nr:hypothetical protein [Clostridium lundense]
MKEYIKKWIGKIKKANIDTFGTDERLDYRIVHKERLEKAREGDEPLD